MLSEDEKKHDSDHEHDKGKDEEAWSKEANEENDREDPVHEDYV